MLRPKPPRAAWRHFPNVVLHATERRVKQHPSYAAAKAGNADAAFELVADLVSDQAIGEISAFGRATLPTLASAHAYERDGVNAIPAALAHEIGRRLGWPVDLEIVQVNVVGHTGASGFTRLANQAAFDGTVTKDLEYVLVDDFIGQGGTIANLRGYIELSGACVVGATALTGRPYSAIVTPTVDQLNALRAKHGQELELWWSEKFGHTFDCLTQSEARYLEHTESAHTIRSKIVAAEQA